MWQFATDFMHWKELLQSKPTANRCATLDFLRGLTVINMILFHACWDLVYLFGMDWSWYHSHGAYIWQQCICCTFILLSGFCSGMSRHLLQRGLTVFLLGMIITLITVIFMPEDLIIFGVLTCIGSCMLIMTGIRKFAEKIPAFAGIFINLLLFGFTRHIDNHFLGIWTKPLLQLPENLYQNYITAYFGFPQDTFYSTDYFPLLPWLFLFLTGFFIYQFCGQKILKIRWNGIAPVNIIGRHALEIYALHQPVIYGILFLVFKLVKFAE